MPESLNGGGATLACPRCGSPGVAGILYGYPAFDDHLLAELEAGRLALGGCLVWQGQPDSSCNACGLEFRSDGGPVRIPADDR